MGSILQLARGAALGGLLAGGLWAIVLFVGAAPGANRIILILLALLGLPLYLIEARNRRLEVLGAIALSLFGVLSGVMTDFGWLEGVLAMGGLLAAVWLSSTRELRIPRIRPVIAAAVAIAAVAIALIPLVVAGETLGHDESAYAVKALAWLNGTPDTGWTIHRGPALSGFDYIVFFFGGREAVLRSIGLVSLVGLCAATWWLGARMFDRRVGAIAAVVVLAGPAILRRATESLTDIPAAALLTACMAIVWIEFERRVDGPTYRLLWVLPLAWTAFYFRYQSILPLGLIGLTLLILWWPRVRMRPAPVMTTAIVGVIGLMPHLLYSVSELGSPIGILQVTGEVAGRAYVGEGIVDYALALGWPLVGLIGIPVVVFFLWWLGRAWREPGERAKAIFLAVPAIGQVLALGVLSHGEPRFVFFPLALVAIGAVAGAIEITASWGDELRVGARLTLVALLFSSLGIAVANTRGLVEERGDSYESIELAADYIEEVAGDDCAVMTTFLPQVTFYSGCFTDRFRTEILATEALSRLEGDEKFMILTEDGRRQPEGEELAALISETAGQPALIQGTGGSALVYEFED